VGMWPRQFRVYSALDKGASKQANDLGEARSAGAVLRRGAGLSLKKTERRPRRGTCHNLSGRAEEREAFRSRAANPWSNTERRALARRGLVEQED
jgi:hypothetical protein